MRIQFLIAALFGIIVTSAIVISCNSTDKTTTSTVSGADDSLNVNDKIEHGRYLATNVAACLDCHSKRDVTKFALPVIPGTEGTGAAFPFDENEGVPGLVWPPNITPFSLKDWTDDEIARAMTQGINKKGDTLFPLMPYHSFSKMTRQDVYSIIAFLRTLPSSDSITPARQLKIPPSMFGPLPANTLDKNVKPDVSDKVNYGKYIITIALCGECHTPGTIGGAPQMERAYSGGFTFKTPFFKVTVANITPDSATGIGTWTEDMFVQKFRTNSSPGVVNRNPGKQNTIMPWEYYGKMKEEDLRAIYAYLRTVKPISNKVVKWAE